ncbi:MAG TPA: hypothetical protein EYP90_14530 [Chromatiaceae bacterium]|nr:hypothetical protein [Chromatiaceae bacterium]
MKPSPPENRDHSLAAAFILLLLFATPLNRLWSRAEMPWYLPYLIWAGGILLMVAPYLARGWKSRRR